MEASGSEQRDAHQSGDGLSGVCFSLMWRMAGTLLVMSKRERERGGERGLERMKGREREDKERGRERKGVRDCGRE